MHRQAQRRHARDLQGETQGERKGTNMTCFEYETQKHSTQKWEIGLVIGPGRSGRMGPHHHDMVLAEVMVVAVALEMQSNRTAGQYDC